MKLKQLGNNGGLSATPATNSSFLIDLYEDKTAFLLYDCGYNVLERLIKEEQEDKNFSISNIKYVVISHSHDDHMGNAESLLYWNFFKHNVQMRWAIGDSFIYDRLHDASFLTNPQGGITYKKTWKTMITVLGEVQQIFHSTEDSNIQVMALRGDHGNKDAFGIYVLDNETKQAIIISGDTRPTEVLKKTMEEVPKDYSLLAFHDVSEWNDIRNPHATVAGMKSMYGNHIYAKFIHYHTGKRFNSEWVATPEEYLKCSKDWYGSHLLLMEHYLDEGLAVRTLDSGGEPFDKDGLMLCTKCGYNDIDDDMPAWMCKKCGHTAAPPSKELIQKLKDKHGLN